MQGLANGNRPDVLFVYPIEATFVARDLDLLRTFCDVKAVRVTNFKSLAAMTRRVPRCDVVFCWFALDFAAAASLVARITGRKSIVVTGGWDVTAEPSIGYGSTLRFRGRLRAKLALNLATRVLAFSDWSLKTVKSIAPGSNSRLVYLGVDTRRFRPAPKERIVVCTSHVSRENLVRKGLVAFAKAAPLVSDARFVLVGRHWDDAINDLRVVSRDRVEFPGWLTDDELRDLLARSQVYVQPSYTEGFGMALAEAMSSGCVPVVSPAGAMPEVVGDAGFYAPYGDERSLAAAIDRALKSDLGSRARTRVEERFTIERRLRELRKTVEGLMQVPA